MTMSFEVWSETLGKICARGEGVIVAFDYASAKVMRIDEAHRAAVVALEIGS
jgi:acyl-CoA thioesterase FadM